MSGHLYNEMRNGFNTYRQFNQVNHTTYLITALNDILEEESLTTKEKNFKISFSIDEDGRLSWSAPKCGEKMLKFMKKKTKKDTCSMLDFIEGWANYAHELNIFDSGDSIALQGGKMKLDLAIKGWFFNDNIRVIPGFEDFVNHA